MKPTTFSPSGTFFTKAETTDDDTIVVGCIHHYNVHFEKSNNVARGTMKYTTMQRQQHFCVSTMYLFCVLMCLIQCLDHRPNEHLVHAFHATSKISSSSSSTTIRPEMNRRQHLVTVSLRASPSLDDVSSSWDALTESLFQATAATTKSIATTADWKKIMTTATQELHWNEFFSREWFIAVQNSINDVFTLLALQPLYVKVELIVIPIMVMTIATLLSLSQPEENYRSGMEPYPRGLYDPIAAQAYYSKHPKLVAQRVLELLRLSNRFIINILIDKYITKREEQNRSQRASELLSLITKLGSTAIKVGQALSVRPDLIPTEYASALSTLQDQVPPFPDKLAKKLLRTELGNERYQMLGIDSKTKKGPVASASIGQVYKGSLGDIQVAVKVQRPNVLAEIALDLYIVREFAPIYQKVMGSATNLQALANEWGRGFIAELDYREEATNTIRFNYEMQARQLNAVCAPTVLTDYSTEQVLVTEWVDGTRLDQSDAADVPRLCAVALNAYLVMLLELKSLHCDPHPGNLLRTTDGRLCILDFGMTLDIEPQLQYSLLEFVAHLTSENYDALPEDLAELGFLKREKLDFARRSGVLDPLKYFLKQAGKGGGANGVRDRIFDEYRAKYPGKTDDELRIEMRSEMKQQLSEIVERESVATGITVEVEELQKRNRDSFQIPEWFLYSSRAFLTLEGVSLQANPNYSLIQSCFPYVAKRLVGDDDPRARKALRDLIYGAADSVDVERLTDLADGFTSYTTTTKSINQQATSHNGEIILSNGAVEKISRDLDRKNKMLEAEATITLAKDSADIVLASDGNLIQNLIVDESALAASAQIKDSVRETFVDGPQRFRDSLPLGMGSLLPRLPFEEQLAPFVMKTEKEIQAQALAEKMALVLMARNGQSESSANKKTDGIDGSPTTASDVLQSLRELEPEQAALVLKELRENVPKYGPLLGQLGTKFVATLLSTASTNIETTLYQLEVAGDVVPDANLKVVFKGISNVAQRGATALSPGRKDLEETTISSLTVGNRR